MKRGEMAARKSIRCSLMENMVIETAGMDVWRDLAEFHYRDHFPGAVDRIFAVYLRNQAPSGRCRLDKTGPRPVGVIVYGMPVPNIALRNIATGGRYTGFSERRMSLDLLNREIRCINRIVIHPQYRGIGLARWLVEETLEKAGTVFVEALAVMGRMHPFFEKAGMVRYEIPLDPATERLRAAFEYAGIDKADRSDVSRLKMVIGRLGEKERKVIEKEICRFAQKYLPRSKKGTCISKEMYLEQVVKHVHGQPVYFLWQRKVKYTDRV